MCILYVRRIRNISSDRDEEGREREGGGWVEKQLCEERQLWEFRARGRMAKLQGLAV